MKLLSPLEMSGIADSLILLPLTLRNILQTCDWFNNLFQVSLSEKLAQRKKVQSLGLKKKKK